MKKLFIVGNGFDLAHGLKTSYEEFHKYLRLNYFYKADSFFIPESSILPDGSEIYDENDVATILIDLISKAEGEGKNWSDVETSLGKLDFDTYLERYDDIYVEEDNGDGSNLWRSANLYENISNDLYSCTIKIKDLFS